MDGLGNRNWCCEWNGWRGLDTTLQQLQTFLEPFQATLRLADGPRLEVIDAPALRGGGIDRLVEAAVFGDDRARALARWTIWHAAAAVGIWPDTIYPVLAARVAEEIPANFTVPALNLRTLTYDMARSAFAAALERSASLLIFELARSEIDYTVQSPAEYVAAVLGAAVKTGYSGPVYFQGDHFQVHIRSFLQDADRELQALQTLLATAIQAGFYNIDIGASCLVDFGMEDAAGQFARNAEVSALLTRSVRQAQPAGITIAVGAQVSPPGGRHSQLEDVRAFLDAFNASLAGEIPGLSKVSVQVGTARGGVVMPDGNIASLPLDFGLLQQFSEVVRNEYGLAGVVQYGASTLPARVLYRFPEAGVCEVHLATEFQNILFEHPAFPAELRAEMYAYLDRAFPANRLPGQTDAQFYYRERKRALGAFKQELWQLSADVRSHLRAAWKQQFGLVFDQLNIANTADAGEYRAAGAQLRPLEDFEVQG